MTASIPAEEWPVSDLEEVPLCPVCGAGRRVLEHASVPDLLFGSPGRWSLHRCQGCRSLYLDPRPSRAAIGRAYPTYYTHASNPPADGILEKLHTRLRYGYLNRRYGCSLEPSLAMGRCAARCHAVIENLHDPLEVLRACRRVLAPGDVLSIATPNADALSHASFGASWRGLEVPRHLVLFTRSGLIDAMTRAGLSVSAAPRGGWEEMWIEEESRRIETRRLGVSDAGRSGRWLRARDTNWIGWISPARAWEIVLLCRASS
jgi:SAM-dependent methyltransferase